MDNKREVILSIDCDERLCDYLTNDGYRIRKFRSTGIVAAPVSNHPDMFMCRLGIDDTAPLICYPGIMETGGSGRSDRLDGKAKSGAYNELRPVYPYDIAYNAACTGRFFIHNLRHTAPELIETVQDAGMELIDVRQGYSKCSTVIVDEDSIITYDRGIAAACTGAGLDVMTVEPGHVKLPGYDTGFIGGASGRIGDTVFFNGDLRSHPDFERIRDFITSKGLEVKWFDEWPLTDIGSII